MRDWRLYVAFGGGVLAAWSAGLGSFTVALVGLAAVAVVLVATRLDGRPDPAFDRERDDRRHGARGEVQELAWAMVARDGRVSERVLKRVRQVGAGRLARHGLVLGNPADDDAIRTLLGARAHRTLTRTATPNPSVSDVRHTIAALETIGTRTTDHGSMDP